MYIRRLPSKRYQCVIRLKGHKLSKTFTQRSDAKTWGREQEYLIEVNNLNRPPKGLTLRYLIEEYKLHSLHKLKDVYNINNQINRLLKKHQNLIDKPYDCLKPIDFENFKNLRLKDNYKAAQSKNNHRATNKDLRLLSIIINNSKNLFGYNITNHINKIKFLSESNGIYRPIKFYEHKILLKNSNHQQKAVLFLLRHTGARPKEIFNLKWDDLDYYKNNILITSKNSKNGRSRIIPVRLFLIKWLHKNLSSKSNYVINITYTSFRFWLLRICKKYDFQKFTSYHYRRYFIQYYADRNMPLPKLALIVGHSSFSMIARYYGINRLKG